MAKVQAQKLDQHRADWGCEMTLLTDTELSDPVYMRAYCEESDAIFSEVVQSRARLRKAAQAVVTRWDTPLWKDVPATAEYIAALRKELAE